MGIVYISDITSNQIEDYAQKTENQLVSREDLSKGTFICESPNVIIRALDAGYEPVSVLCSNQKLEDSKIVTERYPDIDVFTADEATLCSLTGFHLTRGLLCEMRRKKLKKVEDIVRGKQRICILENVMNPTNIGAIFRSAAALGVEAILLSPGCCDPLYRRSVRVSMGNVFNIPWTWIEKGDDYIDTIKSLGFKTVSMALREDSYSLSDDKIKGEDKLCVIMGSEGYGLSDDTINRSDYTVMIPMTNGVDSLNVAAASAVAFWELCLKNEKED